MTRNFLWPIGLGIAGGILFILAIWVFIQGFGGWHTDFEGPGSVVIEIPETGEYRLWHESKTTINGRLQVVEDDLPPGSIVEMTNASGLTVPVESSKGSMSQEIGDTRRVAIGRIEVSEPGSHTVTISGFEQPRRFRLSEIRFLDHFLRALLYGLIGMGLAGAALVWGIILAARRRKTES